MKSEALVLPPLRAARGRLRLPGSKSISNRALLIAALASGETRLTGVLEADDTAVMLEALRTLGIVWSRDGDTVVMRGAGGGFPVREAELFLGNAGTAFRPLTAALALSGGQFKLSGLPRMHERPIGPLVDALRDLGVSIDYLGDEGYPPLAIRKGARSGPGEPSAEVTVRGDISSQFLTALLMALPLRGSAGTVRVAGELISKPYVAITLDTMQRFGVPVERRDWREFRVPGIAYRSPGAFAVESDASSASYFLAAGALGGGPVRVEGVGRDSVQGDVGFVRVLQAMGAQVELGADWIEARGTGRLSPIDMDMNDVPDAAMTAAVLALFAGGTSVIRNVASWRVKETDRLAAMATELRKLGATVRETEDALEIAPPTVFRDATIETYDDHRMAMCFSLAAFGGATVTIRDPGCVAKTFPAYFDSFRSIVETA